MKAKLGILLCGIGLSASIGAPQTLAQVVRESDTSSIAGSLGGGRPVTVTWTFKSAGDEMLYASLSGDIYAVAADHHESGVASFPAVAAAAEEGECEGGPARFCLRVVDASGTVLCQSTRPAPPPGWQRDPRLACWLPATRKAETYGIRVSLVTAEGGCLTDPFATTDQAQPFLLDLSLRRLAPSGTSIQQAVAQSRNQF